jgi:plasmid stabilization system protein ParE
MKVIYTDEALGDLDEILSFLASNYPSISAAFEGDFGPSCAASALGRKAPKQ